MNETSFDFFGYRCREDGKYIITKNGDDFLECTGSEADAKDIVKTLQKDVEKKT